MKEKIFNIFLIDYQIVTGIINKYSVCMHEVEGSDEFKYNFLRYNAEWDVKNAVTFNVPENNILIIVEEDGKHEHWKGFAKISSIQQNPQIGIANIFEEAFSYFEASNTPLYCFNVQIGEKLLHLMSEEDTNDYINKTAI